MADGTGMTSISSATSAPVPQGPKAVLQSQVRQGQPSHEAAQPLRQDRADISSEAQQRLAREQGARPAT